MQGERDHLFISYAVEQAPLVEWLSRRLAALGYAVWCDRLKLLGGENWPRDIDIAIEKRTFRLLALLSRESLNKPNPEGERLKGFAVGKKLGINDFVIPLNVDDLRPDEITWNLQPINYISFHPSWADGLSALVKKLESLKAPRALRNGSMLAAASLVPGEALRDAPETLTSNCFEVQHVPRVVFKFVTRHLSRDDQREIRRSWPCYAISPFRLLAFHEPPEDVHQQHSIECVGNVPWRGQRHIEDVPTRNLVVNLIRKCLHRVQEDRGFRYNERVRQWFLPSGAVTNNRMTVDLPNNRKTWFQSVGDRAFRTPNGAERYRYHLSPSFGLLQNLDDRFVLYLRNRVYLTDMRGTPLEGRKVTSRRKHLCKSWFNKEWCARSLGVVQLLADNESLIRYGPHGDQQLVISATPISPQAPRGIDDSFVEEPDDTYHDWSDSDHESASLDGGD